MSQESYTLHHALQMHSTIYALTSHATRVIIEVTGRAQAIVIVNGRAHACATLPHIKALLTLHGVERASWSITPPRPS